MAMQPGKSGTYADVVCSGLLDHNDVMHVSSFPSSRSRLNDTIQRSRRQATAGFACNSHTARLGQVFELRVAAFGGERGTNHLFSEFVSYIANFHGASIT